MEGAEKYHRLIDPEGQSSVAQLLRWIRPGSKVLEMGPATGIMTQFLKEDKQCDVTCVEVDPKAAAHAKQFCSRMIVGDLNGAEWSREIESECFDYIIFADVLEHLTNPAKSLQHTLTYLKPTGEVLISVPNIAYVGVIAELLEGHFDYRRDGLLDETHLHFFTRTSLAQLLGQTGLGSLEWGRTTLAPEFSEFRLQISQLGAAKRGVLSSVPDGDTYQFLVRCSRAGVAALPVVPQGRDFGTSGLSAQVYFDTGNGFSEQDSCVLPLKDSREPQTLQCLCPAGVRAVRFDPVDSVTPVVLHSFSVRAGDVSLYHWNAKEGPLSAVCGLLNVVEAYTAGRSILVPISNDPAVTVILNGSSEATLIAELSLDGPESLVSFVQSTPLKVSELRGDLENANSQNALLLQKGLLREESLRKYKEALDHTQQAKRLMEDALNGVVNSKSWKITRPLRVGGRLIRALRRLAKRGLRQGLRRNLETFPRIVNSRLGGYLWRHLALGSEYERRIVGIEPSIEELARMRRQSSGARGPTFSVVMPTYKTDPHWLKEAIESVRQQAYPYWELCIADDASDVPGVRSVLSAYSANDPRIKVVFLSDNGHISKSSNAALELATGEYVVLLDHDDRLAPQALYRLAQAIEADSSLDVLYSDEDKLFSDGTRQEPTCKPAWSPDYFLSFMYTGHISCFRTSLVRAVGGFRVGFEGSQDYDLMLRITERTDRVFHIPEVLYHWRVHDQSVAGNLDSKPYAFTSAKKALMEALHRRGFPNATVADSRAPGLYVVQRGERAPIVSMVAIGEASFHLTIEGPKVLKHGLADIPIVLESLGGTAGDESAVIALGCEVSVPPQVLERLRDHCSDKGIGVAGPLIVDSQRRVVSAGCSFASGIAWSNFRGVPLEQIGYRGRLAIPFNVSLMHPACLVFRASLLSDVPRSVVTVSELAAALCLAARKRNLRCVVDPSERVVLNRNVSDLELSWKQIEPLLGLLGFDEKTDPFLPAGLPRYEHCTELPAT